MLSLHRDQLVTQLDDLCYLYLDFCFDPDNKEIQYSARPQCPPSCINVYHHVHQHIEKLISIILCVYCVYIIHYTSIQWQQANTGLELLSVTMFDYKFVQVEISNIQYRPLPICFPHRKWRSIERLDAPSICECNVFDILEFQAFQKYSTCQVFSLSLSLSNLKNLKKWLPG